MGCDEVNKDVLDLGKEMQPFFICHHDENVALSD